MAFLRAKTMATAPIVPYIYLIFIITILINPLLFTDALAAPGVANISDQPAHEKEPDKNIKRNPTTTTADPSTSKNENVFLEESVSTYLNANDTQTSISQYEKYNRLYKKLLRGYNPQIRPLLNQKQSMTVHVSLQINQLVAVDGVTGSMVVHCYVVTSWMDQLLTWDLKETGIVMITPFITDIWSPNLMPNSLESKELLGTNSEIPPTVLNNGQVYWGVADVLKTSCSLNMDKYPFDIQTCHIEFLSVSNIQQGVNLALEVQGEMVHNITKNYDWTIVETTAKENYTSVKGNRVSGVKFTVTVKRKPTFFLINGLLPILVLSLFNCFVFLVPIESGEKIGFGISVLLASAVFTSSTRNSLPPTSDIDGLPAVTKYLGHLLTVTVIAVVVAILNGRLHHKYNTQPQSQDEHPSPDTPRTKPTAPQSQTYNDDEDDDADDESKPSSFTRTKATTRHCNPLMSILVMYLRHSDILGFLMVAGLWLYSTARYFTYVMN